MQLKSDPLKNRLISSANMMMLAMPISDTNTMSFMYKKKKEVRMPYGTPYLIVNILDLLFPICIYCSRLFIVACKSPMSSSSNAIMTQFVQQNIVVCNIEYLR